MLTFDEFFKKKRVDLIALEKAEPALFSEFKTHYEQMGEKSFDHTKKYWFNKTRRKFPLAAEVKTEKAHIANPLAEQTITESLSETTAPAPKLGFAPKFRAGSIPKPAANVEDKKEEPIITSENTAQANPPETTGAKPAAYQPRFKMKPKIEAEEITPAADKTEEVPAEKIEAKPAAYQPRFKMKPKVEAEETTPATNKTGESPIETLEAKPAAYQPRFKMKPKAEESIAPEEKSVEPPSINPEPAPAENKEAKPVYKPRFNMKNIPPKTEE
ncbi:hypothetical protein [Mucilaginibacter sp.]|uniref:hypothetical protein n=1 Tax=Mucilaginibacter sp. TaxID=1882438 RepID=UPI003D10E1DC